VKKTLDHQSGGSHYKGGKVQLWEVFEEYRVPWTEAEIMSHAFRHESKDGLKDLKKVLHLTQGLIESRYGVFVPIDWDGEK